jgi:hypothetical protein
MSLTIATVSPREPAPKKRGKKSARRFAEKDPESFLARADEVIE